MSPSDAPTIAGLPPREVAFRHLASDAWIACELAKRRVTAGFDRRGRDPLVTELAAVWWALVAAEPSPSLFRAGRAPQLTSKPVPAPIPRPPPAPPPPPPPMPAKSAPKPDPAPPTRSVGVGTAPPVGKAPPPAVRAPPPVVKAPPPAVKASPPAVAPPAFQRLPAGVRELAKGLATADLPGAPALKRLIAAHVPQDWPSGRDAELHPSWEVLVVAGARSRPVVAAADLLPLFRAVLDVVTDEPDACSRLDDVVRWGAVPAATCAALLEGLPLLRGSPVPVARAWEVIDAATRPPEGVFGDADRARIDALAGLPAGDLAPTPLVVAETTSAPAPSERWASSLARLRPNVRVAVSRWLDEAAERFGRAATWTEALAFLREHPGLTRPIEAFPEESWAILVEASPVIAQGHARTFIDPAYFGHSERLVVTDAVNLGEAPALAARLRDALLGGPAAALAAPIDALLAALPSSSIANETDAREPPYGRHARWDGARLAVAWPKHAAWKDGSSPSQRFVRTPFWPASCGGAATPTFEVHEALLAHVANAVGALDTSLSDLQDDLDRARATRSEPHALATLRAELIAGFDQLQEQLVVGGDFASDARRSLEATSLDTLETG